MLATDPSPQPAPTVLPRTSTLPRRCEACLPIKFALARMVATYFGLYDRSVQAVYYYEPEPDAYPCVGIHLIVHVDRRDEEVLDEIARTARSLREVTRPLLCGEACPACFALDAHCVDDEDVFGQTGHAALLHSIHVEPIVLWRKQ
jgi:bacterioferritin-associated ferredoxin